MFGKKTSSSKIDETVSQSVNFELTLAHIARRSERRAWWVAGGSIVLTLLLAGGYYYMLPLKEKVPFLVMADAATGVATVARLTDEANVERITSSEAINRSNVAHFLIARESYDAVFLNMRDWKTVLTMASPGVAGAYTTLLRSDSPDNPSQTYGSDRSIRVKILSITLITGNAEKPAPASRYRGASVRFQRSVYNKRTGTTLPLDNKIALMEFTYKSNLKMDEQARFENPLGFQVTSYRVDTDFASPLPAEVPVEPAAAPPPPPPSQPSPPAEIPPPPPVAPVASAPVAAPPPPVPVRRARLQRPRQQQQSYLSDGAYHP